MTRTESEFSDAIARNVETAIAEDVGSGDRTAGLLPDDVDATATVHCRERCVVAGRPWFDEVYRQLDPAIAVEWAVSDGQQVPADTTLCQLAGPAKSLLTGERCALNFLQLLSATATTTRQYVDAVADTPAIILDTRKTLPGLRHAQKYAVRCGGGENHRLGLDDAILIKENHIATAGGIEAVLRKAEIGGADVPVEIEVESISDLRVALQAGAGRVMLDNFSIEDTVEAVRINRDEFGSAAKLEASGGQTLGDLRRTAEAGVDYISVGALTKNISAIDLSMRVVLQD